MKSQKILVILALVGNIAFAQEISPRINLPKFGEAGEYYISANHQKQIRYQLIAELEKGRLQKQIVLQEQIPRQFVSNILNKLAPDNNYINYVIADDSFNASANVGGVIITQVGLWNNLDSVEAFTAVLAHEIVHLKNKHIARMLSQVEKQQWIGLLAILAGIAAADSDINVANALAYSGTALPLRSFLSYSRAMEEEADRNAVDLLVEGGFPPEGMINSMREMKNIDFLAGGSSSTGFEFLRSHPFSADRFNAANQRVKNVANKRYDKDYINTLQKQYDLIKLFIVNKNSRKNLRTKINKTYQQKKWFSEFQTLIAKKFDNSKISHNQFFKTINSFIDKIIADKSLSELELATLINYLLSGSSEQKKVIELASDKYPQNIIIAKMKIRQWLLSFGNEKDVNQQAIAEQMINLIKTGDWQKRHDFAQYLAVAYQSLSKSLPKNSENNNINEAYANYYFAKSQFAKGKVDNALILISSLNSRLKKNEIVIPQFLTIEIERLKDELETLAKR